MKKLTMVIATVGCSAALVGAGFTASWATSSAGPATPGVDAVTAPGGPHTLAGAPASTAATFHPITPCRILDTRIMGGPLAPDAVRTYSVTGTSGFMPQGGKNGGCGIPTGASAIAASLTAPTPAHLGAIRAWPNGQAEPTATVLAYSAGITASTGATLAISATGPRELRIKNYRGPTNLFVDVTGYYDVQISGAISSGGTIGAGAVGIVSVVHNSNGVYQVTVDRDISNCSPFVTTDYVYAYATTGNLNGTVVSVGTWTLSSGAAVSPTNTDFFLTIVC